jgi:hypothetical protein
MTLNVQEMIELSEHMRALGVEEFKVGSFAVRFGPESAPRFISPPANEKDIFSMLGEDTGEGDGYSEEDLLASSQ